MAETEIKSINGRTLADVTARARIEEIKNAATGLVFDTVADMEAYIAGNSGTLKVGQDLFIREADVPDYWWDGTAAVPVETELGEVRKELGKLSSAVDDKADKTGWDANKYLGTDARGNMVEKEAPQTGTGGITEETDPTVPSWAKEAKKPTYTASEVGARPDTWMPTASEVGALPASTKIPGKTSDLTNDSGYITIAVATLLNYYLKTEIYAKTETYSQTEVDNLISGLDKRLNAIADSEDVDLDQLSEVVAYIKSNKSLIDSITTSKVNVSDIADNLTTADSKKPLSAAQGKALKALYDALPAWAKAASKPTYTKSEVGLGNVDNVRQYSADNPPPYPVTSVNGQTGAVKLGASDVGALPDDTKIPGVDYTLAVSGAAADAKVVGEKFAEVSEAIANLDESKQPKGNYALSSELEAETTEREAAIADLNVRIGQQHLLFAEGDTVEDALAWLDENGDTTKVYVLPDGFFYEYKQTIVESDGPAYTNVLPLATETDRKTIYNGKGYSEGGKRLSSSGSESTTSITENVITGFITNVKVGDTIRIKNFYAPTGVSDYLISYNSSNTKVNYKTWNAVGSAENWEAGPQTWYTVNGKGSENVTTIQLTDANFGTGFDAIRISGVITADTIVTINQEIKEGGGTSIVSAWASTGQAFVPTDYDSKIANLTDITDAHTQAIKSLQENGASGAPTTDDEKLTLIRNWDKPVYERLTPFLLSEDLDIDTTYPKSYNDTTDPDGTYRRQNVQAVYDEYNALCTAHPDFVRDITDVEHGLDGATETTFGGLCSDGIQYVRVYEFCEREGRHSNTTNADYWSETKPTFIIVTGIHWEYNGVYSMLNALKIITENPEFRDMRRNCRFIVLPMSNPYCFTAYSNSGGGHYNANGVEIHNNFAVDFNNTIDSTHGTAPLSEIETRYIDNAMRKYADTGVCLLTCHSNASKGSNFIWGSVATKFMCNVSLRLVDLMSYAWDAKYDNYRDAIDTQKSTGSNPQEDGDYRCGFASLSTSTGTETKQALWYGMQGINVEVYERFYLFDPDGTDVSLAVSRGAEVYANLLRLLAVTYDNNDRDKYAPNPPYKSE